jgi:O-antigen ligase
LFGYGFGSAPTLFKQGMTNTRDVVNKITPGPHNQFLEFFVNGGLFALWLIFYILKKQYRKLKWLFNRNKTVLNYYLGVILIPLIIMGITAPIMSMFVYWCGLSMFVIGLKLKFSAENA